MAYIKKTTTLALFLMLVVSLASLSYAVIFYQKSFTHLNDQIKDKNDKIEELSYQVYDLKSNVSSLIEVLSVQVMREENLSEQFISLKETKETVEASNEELTLTLNETASELYSANIRINSLEIQLDRLDNEVSNLTIALDDAIDDLEDICSKSSENISECEDYE